MTIERYKEQFSEAFVTATASVAGMTVESPRKDQFSIDMWVIAPGEYQMHRDPQMALQLKCTANLASRKNGDFSFELPIKNYNDLSSSKRVTPYRLVVVHVPDEPKDWFETICPTVRVARYTAYWVNLMGAGKSANKKSKTICIPRSQVFDDQVLRMWARDFGDRNQL